MQPPSRRCFLTVLLPAVPVLGLSIWLTSVCISELGAVLLAQALLLLLWCCARRPLVSATYLYLVACCMLTFRETLLILSGRMPCGLASYDETCVEKSCMDYNRLPLVRIRTSCARYECTRREQVETGQRVFVSAESLSVWSGSALVFVWAAIVISARQLRQWRARARSLWTTSPSGSSNSRETEYVSVILVVPVTYGLCALHALRVLSVNHEDTWQAEGLMSAAELYSAISLLAFQRLLQIYVKACGSEAWEVSETAANDCAECVHKAEVLKQYGKVRENFQELVAAGLKQYVVLVFGCNALEMVAKTWNWLYPRYCRSMLTLAAGLWFPHHEISLTLSSVMLEQSKHTQAHTILCEDLWNTVSLLMVVANFFTCSIALYAVLMYERTFSQPLQEKGPFLKFWGVKGLLSVNFMQRIVLMAVGLAMSDARMSKNFRTFLNFFLICLETAALAFLNVFAYTCMAAPATSSDPEEVQSLAEVRSLSQAGGASPSQASGQVVELELAEKIGREAESN